MQFTELVERGAFVEIASFSGHRYGTSKSTIEEQMSKGLIVVLNLEMEGVKQLRSSPGLGENARYIFIIPPSFEDLEPRLSNRGEEEGGAVQRRLERAREDIDFGESGSVFDRVVVNNKVKGLMALFPEVRSTEFDLTLDDLPWAMGKGSVIRFGGVGVLVCGQRIMETAIIT
ncbi:P-loop containing nucleoside triphosphate hydrolase protein [Aspergillus venezuelensis]